MMSGSMSCSATLLTLCTIAAANADRRVALQRKSAGVPGKVGYRSRPCGFDTNHNGVVGEPVDARMGDGRTRDPDGDGINEDLLYVDAERGNDVSGDGSAVRPYRTIQKALDTCDGPDDGAEDIVCISGVCHESITITQGGVSGHVEIDGCQYPKNPFMIVGWDRDGDGEYPPYDKDDVAVLDGSQPGQQNRSLGITNRVGNHSYIEIAHLTIRNFGHDAPREGGRHPRAAFAPSSDGNVSHIYFHDVVLESINEGARGDGYGHVIYFWVGNRAKFTWFAFENNLIDRFSGYCFRGVACNGSGHFRLRGNTFRTVPGRTRDDKIPDLGTMWKVWNSYNHLEFLDNLVEGCPVDAPRTLGGSGFGVRPAVQDVVIRGNRFVNLKVAIGVDGHAPGYGQKRCVDRVTIEGNAIVNEWDKYATTSTGGPIGIYIPEGGDSINTVRNITIRENSLIFTQPNARPILCSAGNNEVPQQGVIAIQNNRFVGPGTGRDYVAVGIRTTTSHPQQSFILTGNQFLKTGPQGHHVAVAYSPDDWNASGNTYQGGLWKWGRASVGLPAWQKLSGQDQDARLVESRDSDP